MGILAGKEGPERRGEEDVARMERGERERRKGVQDKVGLPGCGSVHPKPDYF